MRQAGTELKTPAQVLRCAAVDDFLEVPESFRTGLKKGLWKDHLRAENREEEPADSASPVTIKLVRHVQAHYAEELSLKTLSLQLHGNTAYIGQLFRRGY